MPSHAALSLSLSQMCTLVAHSGRRLFGKRVHDPRSLFAAIDRDGSGFIDRAELSRGLKRLDVAAYPRDVDDFVKTLDTNASGQIELDELERALSVR